MYRVFLVLVVLCILTSCASPASFLPTTQTGGVRRPFPQHTSYTSGTIKPAIPQADLDKAVTTFYDAWKSVYLKKGCTAGQYYVLKNDQGDKKAGIIAVSEGIGYGMLITALMAGYDTQAQTYFDGLYAFFRAHPSANDPHLMAWRQATGCVNAKDSNSAATDGDMDVAFALLLADEQWGSSGPTNYRAESLNVIAAIKAKEVSPQYFQLLLGDWVPSTGTNQKYVTGSRTSDWMPDHLRVYGAATGDATWGRVRDTTYGLIQTLQTTASPQTGLLPDFVQGIGTTPKPAVPQYLEGANDGAYGYNACRIPWRIATDYLVSGEPRALAAVRPINRWVRSATGGDPTQVVGGYTLAGKGSVTYSELAFLAPFGVGAMVEVDNQEWLNRVWQQTANQSVYTGSYYNNTLKLLCMLVMSGNWWSPTSTVPTS